MNVVLFGFQEPLYVARVVYDLLFFFVVIIIVLNLIFGVIIDTFADLRSEKQQKELILKNTCFICGTYVMEGTPNGPNVVVSKENIVRNQMLATPKYWHVHNVL